MGKGAEASPSSGGVLVAEGQTEQAVQKPTKGVQDDGRLITRIHGKYYDLTEFASRHPGGPVALDCARDRDGTVLFESYHALSRDKVVKTLATLELEGFDPAAAVGGATPRFLDVARSASLATSGPDARFAWDPADDAARRGGAAFRADLVSMATEYFKAEHARRGLGAAPLAAATKATPGRWAEIVTFGVAFYVCCYGLWRGSWLALVGAPLTGWLLAVNYWHDALHFGLAADWRLNAYLPYGFPFFFSPLIWLHQHTIGHHCHTNDPERDPDLNSAPRVIRLTRNHAHCPAHTIQKYTAWAVFLWSFATSSLKPLLRDHVMRLQGWVCKTVPLVFASRGRKRAHAAGRVLVSCLMSVWPYVTLHLMAERTWATLLKAHLFAWLPGMTFSALFVMNAHVNHLNAENEHAKHLSDTDWWVHQVHTSSSHSTDSYLMFILTGGLNLQIEHHLFPGFNHVHLFHLAPKVQAICAKHGIEYTKFDTFKDAVVAHLEFNAKLADAAAFKDKPLPLPSKCGKGSARPKIE